jgi:hypothetical protein
MCLGAFRATVVIEGGGSLGLGSSFWARLGGEFIRCYPLHKGHTNRGDDILSRKQDWLGKLNENSSQRYRKEASYAVQAATHTSVR